MISIHPYLRNSGSVVALLARAEERGIPCKVRIKSAPKKGIIVSWGRRQVNLYDSHLPWLNDAYLETMTCKRKFFEHVGTDSGLVPEWTTSGVAAREWNAPTVVRFKTAASGGEGLVIWSGAEDGEFPVAAPLYTRYVKKTHEYRCHVFKDSEGNFSVRQTQRKAARRGDDGQLDVKNWQVRNLENGFVFVKNDGQPVPPKVHTVAVELMTKYFKDLDFCALDIIYHKPTDTALVLEGNTAPGVEGTSVDLYLDYFVERLGEGR